MELSSTTPPRFDRRTEELLRRFTLPGLILPHCTLQGPLRHLRKAAQLLEVPVAVICLQFVIGPHTARRRGAMRAVPFLGAWLPAFLLLLAAVPPGAQCQTSTTTTTTTTSTTFPACQDSVYPTCGGTCPSGESCSTVCFLGCTCGCVPSVCDPALPCPFVTKWGSLGSGDGQFNTGPDGVAVDGSGNVFVADSGNNRIQKFTKTGTFLSKWGSFGLGDGQFRAPIDVAVDASGNVYVADFTNDRIQKFTNTGTFLGKWGCPGSGDGQFNALRGAAADGSRNVFVADTGNNRIQKFACAGGCGDVNGDGSVSIGDALVVAQYVVGLRTCAQLAHADRCDVNNNGTCDIGDALRIAQCDAGLIPCAFTCGPFRCL